MNDTLKIPHKGGVRLIAHRGASALEPENTCAAFVAAGNRSYYGIETDLHVTRDGRYAVVHDDTLLRVSGSPLEVEKSTLAELQAVSLLGKDGGTRTDLVVPALSDYIAICRHYEKEAVLELKNPMEKEHVAGIFGEVAALGWLEHTTFISFSPDNLAEIRSLSSTVKAQLLPAENKDWVFRFALEHRVGLDIYAPALTAEMVERVHKAGLPVNCWTVDTLAEAERVIALGVDFITTNCLE